MHTSDYLYEFSCALTVHSTPDVIRVEISLCCLHGWCRVMMGGRPSSSRRGMKMMSFFLLLYGTCTIANATLLHYSNNTADVT
mmetsp:Transcript_15935/g.17835  ORF Transcript_15935/g.17835 Transcript_15935/m.17835 type:complete len:83 (-) Transcript_15935:289-537(-)